MDDSRPALDRAAEAERILHAYGEDGFEPMMAMLERQFGVLHNRAQVLLGLCGIVITTTGFSGRLIAGTNLAAQVLVIAGVALVLISAAVVVWGVLHLRWLTMQPGEGTRQWLLTTLSYRDSKTRYYRIGIVMMLFGLTLYAAALSIMLLFPHDDALPVR
jgi:hypothetical protein